METIDITCPHCESKIRAPFFRELEAKSIKGADLSEVTSREELSRLKFWLSDVSLIGLIKFWLRR